ncbi:MAG: hypothetical protein LQ350_001480 [Teloschistes chrysophthalmus]|nr:MAG: hypothetical protein LQ350_001480 [Niorma chrysophthalma]
MKIFNLVVPLLGLVGLSSASLAPAERQVLVTYPASTPASIVQEAKEAIVAAGGKITEEYTLIKSFAATVSDEILSTINTLSQTHRPMVEDDGTVRIQNQEHLE